MKPYIHAKNSAKKFGGIPSDYQAIHDFIDSSKAHVPDMRHRALLHHSFGCYLVEQIFGHIEVKPDGSTIKMPYIINSEGKHISVRDVAESHIIEDLGFIPTPQDYLKELKEQPWFTMPHMVARIQKLIKKDARDD